MKKEDIYHKYKYKRGAIIGLCVLILLFLYAFKNASFLIRSLSAVGFLILFYMIDHFFDLEFKEYHYFFIVIIAVSSFLLSPLYYVYPRYDKIQHLFQPILFSSIVFHMIWRLDLKLQGVFLRDVQGLEKYNLLLDRNDDTMIDLLLGAIGSAVYSLSVYFW